MPKPKTRTHFVINYRDPADGKICSLKAQRVEDSSLGMSFVAISNFIFAESRVVVDPAEEALAKRFEHVKSLHLSIYHIISIEVVGEQHRALPITKRRSNLLVLPSAFPTLDPRI